MPVALRIIIVPVGRAWIFSRISASTPALKFCPVSLWQSAREPYAARVAWKDAVTPAVGRSGWRGSERTNAGLMAGCEPYSRKAATVRENKRGTSRLKSKQRLVGRDTPQVSVQHIVLALFCDQLLKMRHDLIAARHKGLHLIFVEVVLGLYCQLVLIEHF